MALFQALDNLNNAWNKDLQERKAFQHYQEVSNPDHPDHAAFFLDPKGEYYEDPDNYYSGWDDEWSHHAPHRFYDADAPEEHFHEHAEEPFRCIDHYFSGCWKTDSVIYNLQKWADALTDGTSAEPASLGLLRIIINAENDRNPGEVIRSFFGKEHKSMMFSDIDFTAPYRHHHLVFTQDALGWPMILSAEFHHEFINKANNTLNRYGIPNGHRSTTLKLLAEEWQNREHRGNNPELLERMIQRFYRNLTPIAYTALLQATMVFYTKIVAVYAYNPLGDQTLSECILKPDRIPLHPTDIPRQITGEFVISDPITPDEFRSLKHHRYFRHMSSLKDLYYRDGRKILRSSGDFYITYGQTWLFHNNLYYPIEPDYPAMDKQYAQVYDQTFHKIFRAIANSYTLC